MSTRVDFYLLESDRRTPIAVACQLAVKAWENGQPVAIIAGTPRNAAALDELLWQKPQGRFIPHDLAAPGKAQSTPIVIGADDTENTQAEICINLGADPVRHSGERILEIVANSEEAKALSRRKYAHYRQLGYQLNTHKLA